MTKVSTRPHKSANSPKLSKQITVAEDNWQTLLASVRAKVCPILQVVHERLLDNGSADSACRLSLIAQEILADTRTANELSDADDSVFDVVALLRSARGTVGEQVDADSMSLLTMSAELVEALMFAMSETPDGESVSAVRAALDRETLNLIAPSVARATEDLARSAIAVNGVVDWVISAQDLLQAIRSSALHDPALSAELSKYDIRVNSPDWAECDMGSGMEYLLHHQKSLIVQLAGTAA